jgi:hypothetical protein
MKGFLNKVSGGAKPTGKAGMNEAGGLAMAASSNGIEPTPKADISLPKSQARRLVNRADRFLCASHM